MNGIAGIFLYRKDSDWAHYLGRLTWRDWDPQQYWNWRAYLDFGAARGRTTPSPPGPSAGVYNYKDDRTARDTINALLAYRSQLTAAFEATPVPSIKGEGIEFAGTEGRLLIDRAHASSWW